MAIFQTYIQSPDDPDPAIDNEDTWSKDIINLSSPFGPQASLHGCGQNCVVPRLLGS
jgi:hypothetical protein